MTLSSGQRSSLIHQPLFHHAAFAPVLDSADGRSRNSQSQGRPRHCLKLPVGLSTTLQGCTAGSRGTSLYLKEVTPEGHGKLQVVLRQQSEVLMWPWPAESTCDETGLRRLNTEGIPRALGTSAMSQLNVQGNQPQLRPSLHFIHLSSSPSSPPSWDLSNLSGKDAHHSLYAHLPIQRRIILIVEPSRHFPILFLKS